MAKKDKVQKEKNPLTAKYNSAGKKRTTAQLSGSEKGNIIRVIRGAVSLTNAKKADKAEAKKLAGRMNAVVKENGTIDKMDTASESYKTLKSLARAAVPSLTTASYDGNITGLIEWIDANLKGGGGGGRKGFNPSAYADISL